MQLSLNGWYASAQATGAGRDSCCTGKQCSWAKEKGWCLGVCINRRWLTEARIWSRWQLQPMQGVARLLRGLHRKLLALQRSWLKRAAADLLGLSMRPPVGIVIKGQEE